MVKESSEYIADNQENQTVYLKWPLHICGFGGVQMHHVEESSVSDFLDGIKLKIGTESKETTRS